MSVRWPGRTIGRAIGLLLLLLLAATVALPRWRLGQTSGTPVVTPVPPAPVVGDCLNAPLPASFNVNSSAQGVDSFSQLSLGACRGVRYGEVTALTDSIGPSAAGTDPGTTGTRVGDFCNAATQTYLGTGSAAEIAPWVPQTTSGSLVLAPSPRQQAAGQDWLACVVFSPTTDASAGSASAPLDVSLRGAYRNGADAALIGVCPTDEKWRGGLPGGCAAPHRVEVFGLGNFTEASLPASISNGAAGNGSAPSPGWRIRPPLRPSRSESWPPTRTAPSSPPRTSRPAPTPSAGSRCRGSRRLNGSLIAVGNHPLPWA